MKHLLVVAAAACAVAAVLPAQAGSFADDFEGGLGGWAQTASPLVLDPGMNAVPAGGTSSAYGDVSTDRMYRNLGQEDGAFFFSFWMYDSSQTRVYGEVRAYSGAGYEDGLLQQLFAIGKYTTVTMPGEVWSGTKYQGRIVYPNDTFGWFQLNAPGSPNRSAGWHKFGIERTAENVLNFYVDDILSRSLTGAAWATVDCVTLGFGAGTAPGDVWFDGVSFQVVPEPGGLAALGAGLWAMACGGGLARGVRQE